MYNTYAQDIMSMTLRRPGRLAVRDCEQTATCCMQFITCSRFICWTILHVRRPLLDPAYLCDVECRLACWKFSAGFSLGQVIRYLPLTVLYYLSYTLHAASLPT